MIKKLLFTLLLSSALMGVKAVNNPVDYVSTLVGTLSKHSLSTGNTYPATALPWGMNFWMPQTGKMGDGWAYIQHMIYLYDYALQPWKAQYWQEISHYCRQ